jgi:DNA-binding transcriptional ArsR family regulator
MDMFYALAEPKRRSIIELLATKGQLSASAISQSFRISSPAISQHLKVLREAQLVLMEKRAQQRIYRLNPEAILEIEAWAQHTTQLWNERFNALDKVLALEKNKRKGGIDDRK